MKNAAKILEPYFQQVEAGDMPSFTGLMATYSLALDKMPVQAIELACVSSLLILLYPNEFGKAIKIEWKRRGFSTDMF